MSMVGRSEGAEALLERLRSADSAVFEDAFREVYAAEKAVVYGLLLRLSGDATATADLFQNVWLKLARHRQTLRPDTVLRAWLCTVARNEYLNHRRAQTLDLSRVLTLDLEQPADASPSDPRVLELNAALRQLSDADREVLLMTSVDGLSLPQAAAALGIAEPALRQRLSRARRRLTAELEREDTVWSRVRAWLPFKKESP
jgi:RNA polymerase sigma-70 factor (ECF subfamily)